MRIKTYTSDSVPKALKQIRSDLGPDAVILKTNRTLQKKFLGLIPKLAYEITAAAETASESLSREDEGRKDSLLKLAESIQDRSELGEGRKSESDSEETISKNRAPLETYEVADTPPDGDSFPAGRRRFSSAGDPGVWNRIEKISLDIERLIRLINRQNSFQPMTSLFFKDDALTEQFQKMIWHGLDSSRRAEAVFSEFRRLVAEGVEENLAFMFLQEAAVKLPDDQDIRERLRLRLHRAVCRFIEVSQFDPGRGAGACIFVGPTGVGKTTTLAKIAARMALKEQWKVRLVTFDTYRIAAAEQLKIYGEIIGVPVRVLFSIVELEDALKDIQPDECVLIDTTGHSHKRVDQYTELASFVRDNPRIETHLVLSTTTRPQDLGEVIESFEMFGPDKLVFTKLDETSSYGVILNELIRTEKPLSYLTDGQDVAEDLIIPSESTVADLLTPIC